MIGDPFIIIIRPYLVYTMGMLSDYLIAKGFLMPAQQLAWVNGWVQLICTAGAILLTAIVVYHEFALRVHAILSQKTVTTTTTEDKDPKTPLVSTTTQVVTTSPTPLPTDPSVL